MKRRISRWLALGTIAIALSSPAGLLAQPKPNNSIDDLLKSLGMVKPAMTKAPEFSLRDADGAPVSLSGLGGGVVLLNFWATWCGPCRDEMPSMENLSRNFGGQGFAILAVNQKESAAQVTSYMRKNGLNLSTPLDSDGKVSAAYRVYGIPASYLIDANGDLIGMQSGARDWATREVVDAIRTLIGDGVAGGGPSMVLEPATPMPSALRAKGGALLVRAQQDPISEVVAKLPASEEVALIGKVSGAGEFWYMVRTKGGLIGWVRGAEVEEVAKRK
jgi:thiol-disulfide isomerase/thioredoxin